MGKFEFFLYKFYILQIAYPIVQEPLTWITHQINMVNEYFLSKFVYKGSMDMNTFTWQFKAIIKAVPSFYANFPLLDLPVTTVEVANRGTVQKYTGLGLCWCLARVDIAVCGGWLDKVC